MNPDVSLTIIAVCALILVIFALVAVIYLIQLLIILKKTTQSVEQKINPLIDGATKIINITKNTTECIRNHVESTTPLFHAIGKISGIMEKFSGNLKNDMHDNTLNAINVNLEATHEKLNIIDWADWIASGVVLIQKLRKK